MPRFINVTLGCDWPECTAAGAEGEDLVVEKTLSIDNKPGRVFLICKSHLDMLEETVLPLMQAGSKAEAPKRRSPSTTAPAPVPTVDVVTGVECMACGRTDIKNRAGMAQHVIRSHNFENLAAYEAAYDTTVT